MRRAGPPEELTAEQRAVLHYLVQVTPAARNAVDVSAHTGLALPAAVRCLQTLHARGYVGPGRPAAGERPDAIEYLPTLSGLGYVRAQP